MSIISYAQNFEDVMLWRALKHVKKGYYIDIGAQDPVKDSVSLAFYEQGWRGVHVEPTRQYSQMLRESRPDETVLQKAVGVGEKLSLFEFEDTGLSTGDFEIAKKHKDSGFKCTETSVDVLSLDNLLEKIENQDIHWMKIDVEGLEKCVLQSWKSTSKKPWIVVIESTKPMTSETNHEQWESYILDKGYSFAYFDGLNRFYVSSEHSDLMKNFLIPPNIFDGFVLSGVASNPFCQLVNNKSKQAFTKLGELEAKIKKIENQKSCAESQVKQAEAEKTRAEAKIKKIEHQKSRAESQVKQAEAEKMRAEAREKQLKIEAAQLVIKVEEANARIIYLDSLISTLINSRSWRITAPLRKSVTAVHWFLSGINAWIKLRPGSRPMRVARSIFLKLKAFVVGRPKLKARILLFLRRYPRLNDFLIKVAFTDTVIKVQQQPECASVSENAELNSLTPRERKIFLDLQQAIQKRKGSDSCVL